MNEDGANDIQITQDDSVTPLQALLVEVHEISEGLSVAGFTDTMIAQIVAHMLSDAVMYRLGFGESDDEDDDDDEYDEDDLTDGTNP